jgi:hypothetical protein
MLRRLLGGLSIASLIVALAVLFFWWRSFHHIDQFSLGKIEAERTTYTSRDGRVMVTVSENVGGMISRRSEVYEYWRLLMCCLAIPAFWLAITVRRMLRPARRGFDVDDSPERRQMLRRLRDV